MKIDWGIQLPILILLGSCFSSDASALEFVETSERQPIHAVAQFCVTSATPGVIYFDGNGDWKSLGEFQRLLGQGTTFLQEGSPSLIQRSIILFQEALQIAQNAKLRSSRRGEALFQLGEASFALQDFPNALKYYQAALPLLSDMDAYGSDWRRDARALHGIGKTYRALGRMRSSLNTHFRALERVSGRLRAGNCIEEAIARNEIGEIYAAAGNFDLALLYFRQSLQLLGERDGSDLDPVVVLNNQGKMHFELGNPEKALEFFDRSLQKLNALNQSASLELNNLKSNLTSLEFLDQSRRQRVLSQLKSGVHQLESTIATLRSLSPRLAKNPKLQSHYAAKLKDCETLIVTMQFSLYDIKK